MSEVCEYCRQDSTGDGCEYCNGFHDDPVGYTLQLVANGSICADRLLELVLPYMDADDLQTALKEVINK